MKRPPLTTILAGGLALVFGIATLVEGGHVLFGGPEARAAAGNIVPFVLAFNFGAGFVYVITGAAIIGQQRVAIRLAQLLAVATVLVFGGFGVHVLLGGAFELRTVIAMSLRSGFWIAQSLALPRLLANATCGDRCA